MKAALHLIRAAHADFKQHQEPENVSGWLDLLVCAPIMALFLMGAVL